MSHSTTTKAIRALAAYAVRRRMVGIRMLPSLAVALFPAVIAVVGAMVRADTYALYGEYVVPLAIYFVVPFIAMFTVLPLLGELYDKAAIGYLYTRPAPRWAPILGIYLGAVIAMLLPLFLAAAIPGLILFATNSDPGVGPWAARVFGLSAVLALGGATYGALCAFFGVWSRRAIIWSVGVLFAWGVVFGALPGSIRKTSLHRYLLSLSKDWCSVENTWTGMFVPDPAPPGVSDSLLVLAGASLAFLLLAARASKRRDVL